MEKSKEKNVLALIDHELRFLNGRRRAFEMIRSGEIGKIRHAKYNFRAPHRGDPNLPWTWWSDEKQGGGALGAIVSHVFDTLRWFTDAEISGVFCQLPFLTSLFKAMQYLPLFSMPIICESMVM